MRMMCKTCAQAVLDVSQDINQEAAEFHTCFYHASQRGKMAGSCDVDTYRYICRSMTSGRSLNRREDKVKVLLPYCCRTTAVQCQGYMY